MHWYVSLVLLWTAVVGNCRLSMQYKHVIYIDQVKGNNSETCLTDNDPSKPCRDLGYALQFRETSTQYILSEGVHYLNGSTYPNVSKPFQSLADLAFLGSNSTVECTTPNTGLAFVAVVNTLFQNLNFYNCAALHNSSSQDYTTETTYKFFVALFFNLCESVSMLNVSVTNSPNATGVAMYDTDGLVQISNSVFSHNKLEGNGTGPYPGGGGFYVEFTYCSIGYYQCEEAYPSHNMNATYNFIGCNFTNNIARPILFDEEYPIAFIPHHADHIGFGRGGGLSVYFLGNASNNSFTIFGCIFDSNRALWGGGALVEFHDESNANFLSISNSTFTNNNCTFTAKSGTGGGGLRLTHYVFGAFAAPNNLYLQNLHFIRNGALNGGGISLSLSMHDATGSTGVIQILNCTFKHNIAKLGAALDITRFSLFVAGEMITVHVGNCTFLNNTVQYTVMMDDDDNDPLKLPNYETGVGTVYIDHVDVTFQTTVHFENNIGSALAVIGAPVNFRTCVASFITNYGNKGGAIALLGATYILIDSSTEMYFYNNTAIIVGGAIYNKFIERENLRGYPHCFIRHYLPFKAPQDWGAKFYFSNNSDHDGDRRNSIHTTSIWPCYWAGGSGVKLNKSEILCWKNWKYFNHSNNQSFDCASEIDTSLGSVEFPNGQEVDAFPGMKFKLPMVVRDDLGHDKGLQTVFTATTTNKNIANIDNQYKYLSGEYAEVHGKENESFVLWLDTVRDRIWHVDIKVNLKFCPPGLKTSNQSSTASCVCSNTYNSATMCEDDAFQGFLDNGFWMGLSPEYPNITTVALCPPQFCNTSAKQSMLKLPNSTHSLDKFLCGEKHRTGVLCGECEEGYGPAVNTETYDCVLCNETNIAVNVVKYVAALYIPLTFMFIAIILFNIRLTTGPANAFILYCQVLSSTFDLNGDGQIPLNVILGNPRPYLAAYRCPYGIFNLKFVETIISPLCLGTHLISLDVILLDYLVAFYPLLMIIFVVIFIKVKDYLVAKFRKAPTAEEDVRASLTSWSRSRSFTASISRSITSSVVLKSGGRNRRKFGDSLLPAFAAFLLLSYTKFNLTSSYIVSLTPLFDENGTDIGHERVYFYGKYDSHTPEYTKFYLIPAILAYIIFVAIPPLLLLDYPLKGLEMCIHKVPFLRKFYPFDKVHILLDTFQGCYKNKMRFFAGLYFVFRLVINVAYVVSDTWLDQYGVVQIACVLMIMLLAICQPYNEENKIFNYVDIMIFTNLAIINAISFYLYSFAQITPGFKLATFPFVVQYILVFLPLIYMVAYIIWHFLTPYHPWIIHHVNRPCLKCLERVRSKKKQQPFDDMPGIPDNVITASPTIPKDEDEALFERAEFKNTYRPPSVSPHSHLHSSDSSTRNSANYRDTSSGFHSQPTQSPIVNYGSIGQTIVSAPNTNASRSSSNTGGSSSRPHSQRSVGSHRHVQFEESNDKADDNEL